MIIGDDLAEVREATFAAIPRPLAFRPRAPMIDDLFTVVLEDEWASNYERLELINGDPELRFAHQVETERAISEGTGSSPTTSGSRPTICGCKRSSQRSAA